MERTVEEISASLVREYLSRKGLKRTISCMDEELPRTNSSINNRSDLCRLLRLESLYKKNKAQDCPFKTLLEIIVKHHTEDVELSRSHSTDFQNSPVGHNLPKNDSGPGLGESSGNCALSRAVMTRLSATSSQMLPLSQGADPDSNKEENTLKGPGLPTERGQQGQSLPNNTTRILTRTGLSGDTRSSIIESQNNRAARVRRGMMAGPTSTLSLEASKKRGTRRAVRVRDEAESNMNVQSASESASLLKRLTTPASEAGGKPSSHDQLEVKGASAFENVHMVKNQAYKNKLESSHVADENNMSSMTLDDVDEGDEIYSSSSPAINHHVPQYNFDARPIDLQTATAVKEVIFGSPLSCFSEEWKCQNFSFSDEPDLRYGIVQKKGGPCGVLAAVQACVLQKLLFEGTGSDSALQKLQPSDTQRTKCLALALAEILWRAGDRRRATVALTSKRHHFIPVGHYKSEGILEMITCVHLNSLEELRLLLEQSLHQFQSGPFGCIFLTISAILSRSIEMVRKDMDVYNTTLIGAHGYCTQELVNLLLCGRAVSNVFDDGIALDSGNGNFTLLKGIPSRSDIGLLSLYEHYNICKVGDHLKSPIFPIWVVCSESHFSVLFSCNKDLTSSHCKECTFDLYYYDGLANQQEQIRLTICIPEVAESCQDSENDLVPPLEHCIRTRWRNAVVNWNENEPIL
ncbi:probable ubiquitin carboxyl-terminal hydrolase MINDY-4 [Denticeps clupeoides]|uniref:probable ubiquitin carboxyl-terminal hydrolase MINDY-4 n=1 Tax=Denticeps clupeoides TaxID=299321 RepID=UPI0010A423A4|nr:probable ubiquitin carboxyl-terminal hydrolase MINDY-4 [Denticeps clupeoides]